MHASLLALAFSLLALTPGTRAQTPSPLVVPPGFEATEANSRGLLAGVASRFRQQFLVNGGDLQAASGRMLTALWLRRDFDFGDDYTPSTAHLRIQLADAATPILGASPDFDRNVQGARVLVFDGTLSLPGAAGLQGVAPWAAPYAVRLGFSAPFPYQGSNLCIEVDGTPLVPAAGATWSFDFSHEASGATVRAFGSGCGQATREFTDTMSAWVRNMLPGGTFTLSSVGQPSTPGLLLLGSRLPTPLALDGLGATGCALLVQPLLSLAALYPPATSGSSFSVWHQPLTAPPNPALLGARFAVQAANLETGSSQSNPAALTTTNALEVTLAASLPRGSMTTVASAPVAAMSPLPATGRVSPGRGPVLRLEFQ